MPHDMTDEDKAAIAAEERAAAAAEQGSLFDPAAELPEEDPVATEVVTGAPPPERAIAKQPDPTPPRGALGQLQQYLGHREAHLGQWAMGRIAPEALIRFALADYARSAALQRCTHKSIYLSLIACAQVGLEPGGIRQEAFIVPYKGEAQFQLGYRGIITLARRSGEVQAIAGNVVCEADDFDYDEGSAAFVRHKRALHDRGEVVCAYAYAKLTNGEVFVEVMPRDDLDKIKEHATRAKESPAYRDWTDQMWRKAPIRRLGKRLPLGRDYVLAAQLDALAESGDMRGYRQALADTGVEGIEVEDANEGSSAQTARGTAGLKESIAKQKKRRAKDESASDGAA